MCSVNRLEINFKPAADFVTIGNELDADESQPPRSLLFVLHRVDHKANDDNGDNINQSLCTPPMATGALRLHVKSLDVRAVQYLIKQGKSTRLSTLTEESFIRTLKDPLGIGQHDGSLTTRKRLLALTGGCVNQIARRGRSIVNPGSNLQECFRRVHIIDSG